MKVCCSKIKEIRRNTGCSLQEAHREALKLQLLKDAKKATTVEQLRVIIVHLIQAAL